MEARACTRCAELAATRTSVVFGAGNADADLMFVGEAPGANEDLQGLPFVGAAGKLLETLLGEIGLSRAEVFIANVLKCRPPGNRDPRPGEIENCTPYLVRQVELVAPRVICTLGNFATKLLRGDPAGIIARARPRRGAHDRQPTRRACTRSSIRPPRCTRRATLETLREDFRAPARRAGAAGGAARARARGPPAPEPSRPSPSRRPSPPRRRRTARPSSWGSSERSAGRRDRGGGSETEALGARIAALLAPGDVVHVAGELGAGKTTLVRGACRALGVEAAGDEPDLRDRPPLPRRRRRRRRASRPLPPRAASPARTPSCSPIISAPDRITFVEWPATARPSSASRA